MKKKRIIFFTGLCLIGIFMSITIYAKFNGIIRGSAQGQVASPAYSMDIKNITTDNKMHTYYEITMKNYNENNEISEVAFKYTIGLSKNDGTALPDYTWYDANGNELNKNFEDTFDHTIKQEKKYTICFKNNGDYISSQNIDFNTKIIQKR